MDAVFVPKKLLERFTWDERRKEYFTLIPVNDSPLLSDPPTKKIERFRVEFRREGYVLFPEDF